MFLFKIVLMVFNTSSSPTIEDMLPIILRILCFNLNSCCLSMLVVFSSVFGSLNLTTVKLSGVGSSFQKHTDAESKGIKAHFNMDESGVLLLDRVSYAPCTLPFCHTLLLFPRGCCCSRWSRFEIQANTRKSA